jgi:glycine/D-amino acid oxidase-like deaminating enzyme/nitrite reductase/ring-hydroxylating ferredoxin subunit
MEVRPSSFWLESAERPEYPRLEGDRGFDVAVLGGGLCGITTALLLKRAGARVAVVEARRVGGGASGYTTAKITSLHGQIYTQLRARFGEQGARTYGQANEAAIERVERLVEELGIDCDFRRKPNYTYTQSPDEVDSLRKEAETARELGLPASFTTEVDLPIAVAGAVRFENQAEFHPIKYLGALAGAIPGDGSAIFEQTRALDVDEGSPIAVKTRDATLTADHAVVTTHFPFLDRGGYFARMHPERSYVVAARLNGPPPDGMYISAESPTRSIRTTPHDGAELLLVGGEGHKVGQEPDTEARYTALADWMRGHFDVGAVAWHWSTQDPITADHVPYIGKLHPAADNLYVATGFAKWGMAHATVAAIILSDLVDGRDNPWAALYDPSRLTPIASVKDLVTENINVAKRFVRDRLSHPDTERELDAIERGHGAIVTVDGDQVAAYRADSGELRLLSPACKHMGCLVTWNRAERSWDCPCHGSRYASDGTVLEGPTVEPLERLEVETDR